MQHSAVARRHGVLLRLVFTAARQKTPEAPTGRCSKMSTLTRKARHTALYKCTEFKDKISSAAGFGSHRLLTKYNI